MKNLFVFNYRPTLSRIPTLRFLLVLSIFLAGIPLNELWSQSDPVLSIQGILKKTSGEAVEDGIYAITFKLYTSPDPGPSALWSETQTDIEVTSGIYSTVLGNSTSLDMVPFNQIYYLGVTVGTGTNEMKPRIQLTSAPYALSLIGESNKFPSSGQVVADSIDVNGSVLARMGAPGLSGSGSNGYGFLGEKDSGLFTTGANRVSLYVNNLEEVRVTTDSLVINGEARAENLRLDNKGKISYNGLDDWRLIETDYFQNTSDLEGWAGYSPLSGQSIGWNNPTPSNTNPIFQGTSNNTFEGRYLIPGSNSHALKKQFTIPNAVGNYSYIKIKFKYYVLDTWEGDNSSGPFGNAPDQAFGAIAKDGSGTEMVIGYKYEGKSTQYYGEFNTGAWNTNADFSGSGDGYPDFIENKEMVFNKCNNCNNIFWLIFGAALTEAESNENFGIGMIEIWVK